MTNYTKMYIAVRDDVPDFMVPTLVAHAVLGAHDYFDTHDDRIIQLTYLDWKEDSFRKVVVRVNQKEFDKIQSTLVHYAAHENTTCNGEKTCLVVCPVESNDVPNVLKYAKMWKPKDTQQIQPSIYGNGDYEPVVRHFRD